MNGDQFTATSSAGDNVSPPSSPEQQPAARFALNKNIIPVKTIWNGDKKIFFTEAGSIKVESETMESVLNNGGKINLDPLSEEHCLAITKIFLDIINSGYPVNPYTKLKAGNLKNNKLFKIFIDGCKYYFDEQNIKIFPKSANKPSPLWIMQFLEKSTLLSQRLVDLATKSYSATSWSKVSWFYSNFERSLRETCGQDPHHYLDANNAHQIFNCDSLVLTINLTNFNEKVHKLSQKTMNVICCVSSSGQSIKPLIINRGKSIAKYACDNEIDSKYNSISSLTGKVDNKIFYEWLILFDNQLVELGVQRPVILFLNGIHTYISYNSIQFAANKNIILHHIPPNSSGTLSPLSFCVFPVLKKHFYKKFRKVLIRNKFPIAFIRAYLDTNVAELAVEGFKEIGLCPYNETACSDKFIEKDEVEHNNLCPAKEPVLSLLGKRRKSMKSNNKFTKNILPSILQSNSDLDKLHENLQGIYDNKLIDRGTFESNDPCNIKELNVAQTILSDLPETIDLLPNGSPFLAKSYAKTNITKELKKRKSGRFSEGVKGLISALPNNQVSLKNKISPTQQDNTLLNQSVSNCFTSNINSEKDQDVSSFGNIKNVSVMGGKSLDNAFPLHLEPSNEIFAVRDGSQILSSSGKIGYQIALENMEEVFKNVIDPEILSLYERKLAMDEDYPDTTYLVWCGLQHLKKIISSQTNS